MILRCVVAVTELKQLESRVQIMGIPNVLHVMEVSTQIITVPLATLRLASVLTVQKQREHHAVVMEIQNASLVMMASI